jgi:hypothetical protein
MHAPALAVATAPQACGLFTIFTASALLGTVRSTSAANVGATSSCSYASDNGQARLSITVIKDTATAHLQFMQAERAAGSAARGVFISDEGFSYPGGMTLRSGRVLVNLTGSPALTSAALETAAATVVKQL